MYIIKGFITSNDFVDNNPDTVSPLGELSKMSLTYSKEVGIYKNTNTPKYTLYSFKSKKDISEIEIPVNYQELILRISEHIYNLALEQTLRDDAFYNIQILQDKFGDEIKNINVGDMVYAKDVWMPEWISFSTYTDIDSIKVWFSDEAFSTQYDETEFRIVPPIKEIDNFQLPKSSVDVFLKDYSLTDKLNQVELIKREQPYTKLIALSHNHIEDHPNKFETPTDWMVLVYGKGFSNDDLIKNALRQWILDNSNLDFNFWFKTFPSIFRDIEFIITPLWHKFAIPNQTVQSGFNSPIIEYNEISQLVDLFCKGLGFEQTNTLSNTISTVSPIRNLSIISTGSSYNPNGSILLSDVIPDYINVSTSSLDFTRMRASTQNWIKEFIDLLILADTKEELFEVPIGYGIIKRDNITYVSRRLDKINYLVPTKKSILSFLNIESPYFPDGDAGDSGFSVEEVLFQDHIRDYSNPHVNTALSVGLESLDNIYEIITVGKAKDALIEPLDLLKIKRYGGDLGRQLTNHLNETNPHNNTAAFVNLENLENMTLLSLSQIQTFINNELTAYINS